MPEAIKRVQLPSGGWWEVQTRPLWRHVWQWSSEGRHLDGSPSLIDLALLSLTAAWSFGEEITFESLARRDESDLLAVYRVLCSEIISPLERPSPREKAQALFASLAAGQVPPEFAEAHLMARTGWTWHVLQDTPADVVQQMWIYLAVAQVWHTGSLLEFPDSEGESCD
jgi:hypothetical protein